MTTNHPQHDKRVHKRGNDYETPQKLFEALDAEFGFTVDVCASDQNAKCDAYYTDAQNGLLMSWQGVCWMNPPYSGSQIGKWVRKAWTSAQGGATVVCLLPAKTDTRWWHSYCLNAEVRFIKGRLTFVGQPNRASFPSAIVIFRPLA